MKWKFPVSLETQLGHVMLLLMQIHGRMFCWEQIHGIFLEAAREKDMACFAKVDT